MPCEDYDHAIGDFNEAIRLDPKYVDAYFLRGTAYSQNDNFNAVIITCRPDNWFDVMPPGRCNGHGRQAADRATAGCHQHQLCRAWLYYHRRSSDSGAWVRLKTASRSSRKFVLKSYAENRRMSRAGHRDHERAQRRSGLARVRSCCGAPTGGDHVGDTGRVSDVVDPALVTRNQRNQNPQKGFDTSLMIR